MSKTFFDFSNIDQWNVDLIFFLKKIRHFSNHEAFQLFNGIETLLSKASHSPELVARINHSNLTCNRLLFWTKRLRNIENDILLIMLQNLTKGIGDYLMRVAGSVPIGLRITLETGRNREGCLSCDYERDFV